jgi:hypothetical protein
MSVEDNRVILFEDDSDRSTEFVENFDGVAGDDQLDIIPFSPDEASGSLNELEALKEEIRSPDYPLMVVLDQDLTEYTEHGIRRQDVRQLCDEENIPLCIYHRRRDSEDESLRLIEEYEEDVIKLDPSRDFEKLAEDAHLIARGFKHLRSRYSELKDSDAESPIGEIVQADKTVRSKVDQYAWGNPRAIIGGKPDLSVEDSDRRFTTLLGYWIYNELLRFPGALLNPVATAAYLGVDHDTFSEDEQYHQVLEDAKYEGPFAESGKWWWKALIDEERAKALDPDDDGMPDGSTFFERKGCDPIGSSHCHDEEKGGEHEARYYGVMMEKPVCKEHSKEPSGWLPMGASRSRISVAKYAEYNPWMMD